MNEPVDVTPTDDRRRDGATLQLLVDHAANRRQLADQLEGDHHVVETAPDDLASAEFDVCIVDGSAYDRHRSALNANKGRAAPVFRPILLLTARDRIERLPDAVWDAVDDVLGTPVAPNELRNRLGNLLERRRLSLELKRRKERSDERFRTIFETAPDPIVVTDADGTITEANDVFARIVGRDRSALIGTAVTDLGFSPSDAIERILLRVDAGDGGAVETSVQLGSETDDPMITDLNADVVTAIGDASERIGIFRDVTARERREAEMREQNDRLEEFASTIAHDLRNPLSIAKGHLDLAWTTGEEDYFETVVQAHDRMEQLIDEILSLARLGQHVMDPEPVDLGEVARAAWEHTDTGECTLSIESSGVIEADEGRLQELFENLFRNVRDHGGEAVAVGLLEDRRDVAVHVTDDGEGIPAADRAEVFESGFTSTDDGTGFGLSIVRQIVEGHGWDVTVTEGPAGGARFEISRITTVE